MRRPSRNDECWCGSGEKYKKCHLDTDENMLFRLEKFKKNGCPIPSFSLIYSPTEIESIRRACRLTAQLLTEVEKLVFPGVKTNEIDAWVDSETRKRGAVPAPLNYKGFPKSVCISINEVVCHGIPSERTLKSGDIVNIDITCILDGFYGDASRMYLVGDVSESAKRLVDVTRECLMRAVSAIRPFEPVNNVGKTIQPIAEAAGFSVVRDFVGHGVGKTFHHDPYVCHYNVSEPTMILVPNMVFTIEPMINAGAYATTVLKDGWTAVTKDGSLSAQWEHTILVTENGAEILTVEE